MNEIIEDNINDLSVGDIIWAKRYKNEEEKENIKVGHQESPFIVIKIAKGSIYTLQCTSNPHERVKWQMLYYQLGRLNYDMRKCSYVYLCTIIKINENQYINKLGHLDDYDLNQIKKHLFLIKRSNVLNKPNIEDKYLDYTISIGDVINYNNKRYYVYNIKGNVYETHRLNYNSTRGLDIVIKNNHYSFEFEKKFSIFESESYTLIDTFNTGEVLLINDFKDKYLQRDKFRVGMIILYKGLLYYIYKVSDNFIRGYLISNNNIYKHSIIIENKKYYTNFSISKLIYKQLSVRGYKIMGYANNDEIEYNKKSYNIKDNSNIEDNLDRDVLFNSKRLSSYVPMVIIKNTINKKYYLIIDKKDNILEIVDINNISDLIYFELDINNNPFKYCRVLSKDEFDNYLNKINEIKKLVENI